CVVVGKYLFCFKSKGYVNAYFLGKPEK
ncbi:MAG: hypothetical protein ACI9PU_002013, partial [Ascidiaceihabitans sp.]